jgi:1,4-dihydroxy-2-naphthoyl-CoA hydrolase
MVLWMAQAGVRPKHVDVVRRDPCVCARARMASCSRTLLLMSAGSTDRSVPPKEEADASNGHRPASDAGDANAAADESSSTSRARRSGEGPSSLDGVSGFMGMRWEDPQTIRLQIRPELINAGGLLSGVVTYALVDYCMGSALWAQTTSDERIATISISINYIQTATEGEIVCRTVLDRRNRTTAVLRSEVRHEDDRLLVTAIGSYTIFARRRARPPA